MADISTPADFRKMRRLSARFELRTLNGFCFASTFFGPLSFFFYRRLCREDVFQTQGTDLLRSSENVVLSKILKNLQSKSLHFLVLKSKYRTSSDACLTDFQVSGRSSQPYRETALQRHTKSMVRLKIF